VAVTHAFETWRALAMKLEAVQPSAATASVSDK
jgi:hypothetical protein